MKKIAIILMALLMSVASHAQFDKSKIFVGGALTNLDLSYNGIQKGRIGLQGKVGYFLDDNLMADAHLAYEKQKDFPFFISGGLGIRYYLEENGLFFGASTTYKHSRSYNDLMPSVQVGYAFFISRTVTIEPEIYYEQSIKCHKDYSTLGLRIGVGIYLFQDQSQN